MTERQKGFSLIELLVSMAVFTVVIVAASAIFIPLVNQFKQQTKIAETNIEGIVGLELLRVDIEHAGYGVPWSFQHPINYAEATSTPASSYNDAPGNPPRAIVSGDNVEFVSPNNIFNGSDYLVIKSVVVSSSATSQRWSYITTGNNPRVWNTDKLENGSRVIVVRPKVGETKLRELVVDEETKVYYTTYSATAFPMKFSPVKPSELFLIYGIDPDTDLRMPFNRADYFISKTNVPQKCASKTGVLEKAVVSQAGGGLTNVMPLLDCVADMQVIYRLDMDDNGVAGTFANADGSSVSSDENEKGSVSNVQATMKDAALLRDRLKEVRVYILTHEGQSDSFFTFNNFTPDAGCGSNKYCIRVGEKIGGLHLGRDFDLSTIPNYLNYRWKVYTLVAKPQNLR
jgi:prepilin-type N-terminal cleavage/methylation domain-containing protein